MTDIEHAGTMDGPNGSFRRFEGQTLLHLLQGVRLEKCEVRGHFGGRSVEEATRSTD